MTRILKPTMAWWVNEALLDTHTKVFAVTAGLGAGKTHGMAQWHHDRVALNSESPFSAFVEPIYAKIHDSAIPTFRKVLGDFGYIENVHYKVVKSPFPKLIYFTTGQEIHFLSADRPQNFVAVEYSHATMDEAGSCDVEAYRNLRSRIRCSKAVLRQMMVGGTPQGVNWYAETFDSETLPDWDLGVNRDHFLHDKAFRRFMLGTTHNPFLPDDYAEQLYEIYGHNPGYVNCYILGKFSPLVEGNAYKSYNPALHDIEDMDPDRHRTIYLTWDFNANPLAWIAMQPVPFYEDITGRIHRYVAMHEANEGSSNLDDACVEFAMKMPPEQFASTPIEVYGDMSGHAGSHKVRGSDYDNIKKYLKRLGYKNVTIKAARSNPREVDSVEALNRLFSDDLHRVCKRCTMYRKSLVATCWKPNVRKLDKPSKGDTWTHHGDAGKYFAYAKRGFTGGMTERILGTNL